MPVTYSRKEAIANACGPKGPAAGKPMGVRFSLPVSLPIRQPFLVLYTTSKRSSRQFSSQLEARRKVLKSPCDHSAIRNSVVCPLTSDLRPLTSCCLLVPSEVAGLPAANCQLFSVVCHLSSVVCPLTSSPRLGSPRRSIPDSAWCLLLSAWLKHFPFRLLVRPQLHQCGSPPARFRWGIIKCQDSLVPRQ